MIIISEHGAQRLRERNGLKKKSMERHIYLALTKGTPRTFTGGCLRHWLDYRKNAFSETRDLWVYGDKAYVFDEKNMTMTFVTVLNVPTEIKGKNLKNMIHERPVAV